MTIITSSAAALQSERWQDILRHAIRDVHQLGQALGLELADVPADFPLLVPMPFVSRMRHGDILDPLLLQVLPTAREHEAQPGYVAQPLLETDLARTEGHPAGLLQKYDGRALVITTGACAVNCRYCFRRHFPYESQRTDRRQWQQLADYLSGEKRIREVILSGGDPFMLSDALLAELAGLLASIPQVETLRIHTRLPVVIPQRVTDEMVAWLGTLATRCVIVIHTNHANEIDDDVKDALARLRSTGAMLLNQSVLLRGVNDSADALGKLSRRLLETGVLPYYLHLLDPVEGAAHFNVDEQEARNLMHAMTEQLPGYLVPRLVREVPGTGAKQLRFP